MPNHAVFIAYASPDRDCARALHDAILARGDTAFLDERGIEPGADWDRVILDALEGARTLAVLVSRHTRHAQYQRDEIARVCGPEVREKKRVVPILLHADAEVPYGLAGKQQIGWSHAHQVAAALLGGTCLLCPYVVGPVLLDDELFVGRDGLCSDVVAQVAQGNGVQLLGERRMGKSSVLRWLERHLPRAERRVVYVDGSGGEAADAHALVRAIADGVGAPGVVRALDRREKRAVEALVELPKTVVLLDEAERVAERAAGFDDAFFGECRRLSQARRIVWVTASFGELSARFQAGGRTSPFGNDTVVREVGALEAGWSQKLLPGMSAKAWVEEVSAGQAIAAQAAARRMWRVEGVDEDALFDVVDAVKDQAFGRWLGEREVGERAVIEAWREGRVLGEVERFRRRRLERRGVWPAEGSAWAWWVRHG